MNNEIPKTINNNNDEYLPGGYGGAGSADELGPDQYPQAPEDWLNIGNSHEDYTPAPVGDVSDFQIPHVDDIDPQPDVQGEGALDAGSDSGSGIIDKTPDFPGKIPFDPKNDPNVHHGDASDLSGLAAIRYGIGPKDSSPEA